MAELSHKFSPKQELAKYISKNITATKKRISDGWHDDTLRRIYDKLKEYIQNTRSKLKMVSYFLFHLLDVYCT